MLLKSLMVRNYRSCNNTKSDFHERLSCLVGRNGAGKTNFLCAVRLLKDLFEGRRYYRDRKESAPERWSCELVAVLEEEKTSIRLKAKVLFADTGEVDQIEDAELRWTLRGDGAPRRSFKTSFEFLGVYSREWRHGRLHLPKSRATQRTYSIPFYGGKVRLTEHQLKTVLMASEFVAGIRYYGASRFTNPLSAPSYLEIEPTKSHSSYGRQSSHERLIYDIYQTAANDADNFIEYKKIICEDLQLIKDFTFENIRLPSSQFRVLQGGRVKTIESERLVIIPHITLNNGKIVSPSQLSEGTFKTIALLYYLVTESSKLLLVEEPEVCIHHGLLDRLLDLIKSFSFKKQIIISTHSEFVLDVLNEENILVVKNRETHGTKIRSLSKALSHREAIALRRYLQVEGNLGEYLSHANQNMYE